MKQAYTGRSNTKSKAQANMHTSRNNQCNPDMQCSNTWTMDTSHDCKSDTKSIIIIIKYSFACIHCLWGEVGRGICTPS